MARAATDLGFSAFVTVAAFLPRLYVAIALPREPVWDGHYYDFGARRIAAGLGYSDGAHGFHPWCHWPVGYSGFLAAVYRIFDDGPHASTVAGAVVGALTVLAVHRLGRHMLSPARARAAAVLSALHPGLIAYAALVMTEPLSAFVLVATPLIVLWCGRQRPLVGAAAGGFALGLGALVHPTFLAYAPAVALLGPLPARSAASLRAFVTSAAVATAVAFVPVLPWTLRNCRVMDRCALISTNGGWNLAIGAFPHATGRFETLRATDGCAVVTGQVQQDACFFDLGVTAIKADPWRWVSLMPKKLGFTFDHESFPVEYLHEADPERWPDDRRRAGRALLTTFHRLLLSIAAFALVGRAAYDVRARLSQLAVFAMGAVAVFAAWWSEDSPFYGVAIFLAVVGALPLPGASERGPVFRWAIFALSGTLVTHAVFFGEDRYHLLVTPILCLLAAAAFRPSDAPSARGPETLEQSSPLPPTADRVA